MSLNCIIIHGCPSNVEKAMDPQTRTYDKHWIPWVKRSLEARGVPTQTPLMPDPWYPEYARFKAEFEKYPLNEDTVLIGHSCGASFLVRWLGDSAKCVKKLILVAPWKHPEPGDKYREPFYTYRIDPAIRERVGEIVMFTSDTEEEEGKVSLSVFHTVLGGRVIELKDHGHYTYEDMGTEEFPELIKEIL